MGPAAAARTAAIVDRYEKPETEHCRGVPCSGRRRCAYVSPPGFRWRRRVVYGGGGGGGTVEGAAVRRGSAAAIGRRGCRDASPVGPPSPPNAAANGATAAVVTATVAAAGDEDPITAAVFTSFSPRLFHIIIGPLPLPFFSFIFFLVSYYFFLSYRSVSLPSFFSPRHDGPTDRSALFAAPTDRSCPSLRYIIMFPPRRDQRRVHASHIIIL